VLAASDNRLVNVDADLVVEVAAAAAIVVVDAAATTRQTAARKYFAILS